MKNHLLTLLIGSAALIATSCSDDFSTKEGRTGHIAPLVDLNTQVVTSRNSAPARSASDIAGSDLSIRLTDPDGVVRNYNTVADFPTDQEFKVGNYTLEAYYGTAEDEGFEKPYYYGTTTFEVLENETAQPSLTAKLANAMVSVDYTDAFKGYFKAYTTTLQSVGGQPVEFTADETRPGHVKAGSVTISIAVTKQDGTKLTLTPTGFAAEARHHYHLTLDANEGNVNAGTIVLSFDDMLAQEDAVIDLSDALNAASAPYITTSGFTTGDNLTVLTGTTLAEPLRLTIMARAGLSSVAMTTTCTSLAEQGWPANVDLAAASSSAWTALDHLGLSTLGLSYNVDKMAVVDLTDVISHIEYIEGTSNTATFTFVVKDIFAREATAELTITLERPAIALTVPSAIVEGQTTFDVDVAYNGTDAASAVKIQYKNDRGTWSDATVNSVTEAASRATTHYIFNITVPQTTGAVKLRAVSGSLVSGEVDVDRVEAPFELSYPANDVFASRANISLTAAAGVDLATTISQGALHVSSSDGGATPSATHKGDGLFALTGLTPGKTYSITFATSDFTCMPISFTTEAATQLPNNSMEEWCRTDGLTQYWWVEYPGSTTDTPWGTMNLLTTSEGGSSTSMFQHNGCSYNAYSGTRQTTDSRSGSAAIIETVGWGSGNTAAGNSSKVENVTAGELYLGNYDASSKTPVYGYAFGSRPSALTFWYKYTAKNSADYGAASVSVLDAAGNVLATSDTQLSAADAYTQVTLPLTYAAGAAKAAKISVVFKSSGNADCINSGSSYMDHPKFGNLSDGRNVGSSLYVDDIVLTY